MTSIDLTIGETDFGIEFKLRDETTGGAFDITSFVEIRLFIVSTDFVTQKIPGGVLLQPISPFTDGVVVWDVQGSQIPTPSDQYYGIIVLTDTTSGEIRKTRRFNLRSLEAVST